MDKDTANRLSEYNFQVLKEMKNNKSPDSDGFTAEFFKFFWSDLNILLVPLMIYLYRNNYQYHKDLESFYVYLKVTNLGNF